MTVRAVLLSVIALHGCCSIPIGDEVFTISGTAPPGAEWCDVFLRTEGGEEVPRTRRRVSGQFTTHYPVTRCTASYHVIVTCDGNERRLAAPQGRESCAG